MKIIPVIPRGYCQGVVRAIGIAKKTAQEYKGIPIHMLGMIVHNKYVVRECQNLGITCLEEPGKTRLELLDAIDDGVVIFTAHGVSDEVRRKAEKKGLVTVDATCPDVLKTHDLIRRHCQTSDVVYIGKKGHPEAEGAVGLSSRVHLVASEKDVEELDSGLQDVLITNQTTLSLLETAGITKRCLAKFPGSRCAPEICRATQVRQEAVMGLKDTDVLIVVGDPHSNNTNQLRQIGLSAGIRKVFLVENCTQLEESMLENAGTVAVTAGSSTPTILTSQVISFLQEYASGAPFIPPDLPEHVF